MSRTRNCIRCGRKLVDGSVFCTGCDANSMLRLCRHLSALPAWRVMIREDDVRRVYALTIGQVTVTCAPEDMLPLVNAETGRTIPARDARSMPSGTELVVRATLLQTCHTCGTAFLLPDSEAGSWRGEPRIVRRSVTLTSQALHVPQVASRPMIDDADLEVPVP